MDNKTIILPRISSDIGPNQTIEIAINSGIPQKNHRCLRALSNIEK